MPTEQYLSLFFSLFDTGIPWAVIGITVLMAIFASAWLYHRRRKQVLLPWIMAVLFLMLYSTVIGRLVNGIHETTSLQIIPFWSIGAIQEGYIETLYEKIYNVIFFVPYGVLLGVYFEKHPVRNSILIGYITSIGIELLQFITRTGTCETDDVICNTVGCGIGALLGVGICWMIGKIRNK